MTYKERELWFTCISLCSHNLQGSSAFVYGWVAFGDRLSNGVVVKIIQQLQPTSLSDTR